MWFEIILVFILFKFKKRPNISGIQVVVLHSYNYHNSLTKQENRSEYTMTNKH